MKTFPKSKYLNLTAIPAVASVSASVSQDSQGGLKKKNVAYEPKTLAKVPFTVVLHLVCGYTYLSLMKLIHQDPILV